jgi:hypothetical protein
VVPPAEFVEPARKWYSEDGARPDNATEWLVISVGSVGVVLV